MDSKFVCKPRFSMGSGTRLNIQKLDPTRCFFVNSAIFIFDIRLPYISMGLLILIMLISIFGRIKENYRWFILNQAIWDFVNSYYELCDPVIYGLDVNYEGTSCFYKDWDNNISYAISEAISSNTYSALFLLTFTRFICLYFMHFYKKLTEKRRIFYLIIIFDVFHILTNLSKPFIYFKGQRQVYIQKTCPNCDVLNEFWYRVLEIYANFIQSFSTFKEVFYLFMSVIASICIIAKIVKRFRFQLTQNRQDFYISARIAFVLSFQTLINLIIAFLIIVSQRNEIDIKLPFLKGATAFMFDKVLPLWITGLYGLSRYSILEAITQIRIFIEAILVLLVMAGYREAILKVVTKTLKFFVSIIPFPKSFSSVSNNNRQNNSAITIY